MYLTNGSFIKVHSREHKHPQVSLIGLKDEFDDESSTIEEDEEVDYTLPIIGIGLLIAASILGAAVILKK